MTPKKQAIEDLPVTQGQLKEVAEQLQLSINTRSEELSGRLDRVEQSQDKILDAVQRIEAQLRLWQDLPARVIRLEQARLKGA